GYSVNDAGAIVVTNTHIPETTSVSVLKIWEDFQDMYGLRPLGISVQLLQDGSPYGAPVLLNDINSWTHTWNDLPGKNIGVPYTYTVAEITAVPGYTTSYIGIEGSFTITNTLKTFYIELIKLDARDETTPLAGATFELRTAVDDNGNLVPGALLETLTTDAAGKAKTVGAYGPVSYFLVETVAPDGFHLLTDPILVELDPNGESGTTVTVTLYDEFIHNPDLTISKLVANISTGSPPAELSEAIVGENVQYTVVVTNSGNVTLTNVILTDDEALIGSNVTITGQGTVAWIAGPGGLAAVNLGDMAPGAMITLIYDYAVVAADLSREPIINTATATGTMLPTSDYPDGAVLQVSDTAIVTVDDIPLSLAAISLTKLVQNLT
ncbi:MAG: Cna B-type domain-containing protein, partial [Bacillota bacterium]|nr:Cna B-type domain-containing protein [Bacillota bacterium]